VFETAVADLRLETPEGEAKHLYPGNMDLAAILVNYIKATTLAKGHIGVGIEYFKSDPLIQRLFTCLGKVSPLLLQEFQEERKRAELMFDEAVKQLK
jgi:hypothetical protein